MNKCTLKMPYHNCKELYLTVLHDVSHVDINIISLRAPLHGRTHDVMLKVVSECLHNGERTLVTHAVLDYGADTVDLFCSPKLPSVWASQLSLKPSHCAQ